MPLLLEAPEPALAAQVSGGTVPRVQVPWRKMGAVLRTAVLTFVAFLVIGNLLIIAASAVARTAAPDSDFALPGVPNLHPVDDHVWRGAAPDEAGYRSLADAGVTTVVDLRAEDDVSVDEGRLQRLGLEWIHLPVRDGQVPTQHEVDRFLAAVRGAEGRVFVHCGAGVGRTGAMAAAYLTATGQASGMSALGRNLTVGPPSLEQIAFAASLRGSHIDHPNVAVTAFSRVLDAPRRLWSRYGF
jgi:protein-tyrosine phosphatase